MITRAISEYNLERARQVLSAAPTVEAVTAPTTTAPATGRRLPPKPSWWSDDEDATRSSLMVAQALDVRKGKPA